MQDFEQKRYAEAMAAFASAFKDGFTRGERALAAGDVPVSDVTFPIRIDVGCDALVDGVWEGYVARFRQAGFDAARSTRRRGRIELDAGVSNPDERENRHKRTCSWFVIDCE